jgi:hypothetical protein
VLDIDKRQLAAARSRPPVEPIGRKPRQPRKPRAPREQRRRERVLRSVRRPVSRADAYGEAMRLMPKLRNAARKDDAESVVRLELRIDELLALDTQAA